METKSYTVVFEGKTVTGRTIAEVKKNLALIFKVNARQIEQLFSKPAIIIKKNLSYATALKYQRAFEKTGAICRIEADAVPESQTIKVGLGSSKTTADVKASPMICPMCNHTQASAEECIRCGIVIRKYLAKMNRPTPISGLASSIPTGRQSTARSFRSRWLLAVPVILLLIFAMFSWREKSPMPRAQDVIVSEKPVQTRIRNPEKFSYKEYQITPLATFQIEARVLSTKRYHFGREAELSPIDLALGWGRMSDENVLKDISIRQSNRFYFWRAKQFPIPRNEIVENSANMHIIPANKHIEQLLKDVRQGHVVMINGYLVRVDSQDHWHWQSSLTRKDTGRGACELIWAEELVII